MASAFIALHCLIISSIFYSLNGLKVGNFAKTDIHCLKDQVFSMQNSTAGTGL